MNYFQNVKSEYGACVTLVVDYCPSHHILKGNRRLQVDFCGFNRAAESKNIAKNYAKMGICSSFFPPKYKALENIMKKFPKGIINGFYSN